MRFLIDANLPCRFSLWDSNDTVHVYEIDPMMSDKAIWDYAKQNNMTIVTKDADFSELIMANTPPPRVVHIKIGNMKIAQLHDFLGRNWEKIKELSETNKLINVYRDKIVCVGS